MSELGPTGVREAQNATRDGDAPAELVPVTFGDRGSAGASPSRARSAWASGISRREVLARAAALGAAWTIARPSIAASAPQPTTRRASPFAVLNVDAFKHHVDRFNAMEPERVVHLIPNAGAWDWMAQNVPAFECPDAQVQEIYWYRWWTYRKALMRTPGGRIAATEFIARAPVSSAVGHHVMEGRWLRDPRYVDDLLRYWMSPGDDGGPPKDKRSYSGWTIWSAHQRALASGDDAFLVRMIDDFVAYYEAWERDRMNPDGSFWQFDVRDAMEESISGSRRDRNLRPPLNSYMYGNATALAAIGRLAGRADLVERYERKAAGLKAFVQDRLWDDEATFFKVRHVHPGRPTDDQLSDAREQIGFIPWYFDLPDPDRGYEAAWAQLIDREGFAAPWGITTAERRHPRFRFRYEGGCEWNGPVWPFATSQTLTALANVLNTREQPHVTRTHYLDAVRTYARCTYREGRPYIGEYYDERTGEALHKDPERGRYYNHSTFCDLIINGLVGLRPRADRTVEVNPLLPPGTWDHFCLDGVPYHGRSLTVLWDRTGERYGRGQGLRVLADGEVIARAPELTRVTGDLP